MTPNYGMFIFPPTARLPWRSLGSTRLRVALSVVLDATHRLLLGAQAFDGVRPAPSSSAVRAPDQTMCQAIPTGSAKQVGPWSCSLSSPRLFSLP